MPLTPAPPTHPKPRLRRALILCLILAAAGLAQTRTAYATPAPPVLLVNPTLQQCIENVYLSDECHTCRVVAPWEVSPTGQCPAGYRVVPYQELDAGQDHPLDCVEGPRNEWMACTWGQYPTVTPLSPAAPAPSAGSGCFLPLSLILCAGAAGGVLTLGGFLLRRKKLI